jgi:hypothetical protein
MRELQVLGNGHLRLDFVDWKEFFEAEMAEQLRHQLKSIIEQGLEAERDYYLQLNYYEHAPRCRLACCCACARVSTVDSKAIRNLS